MRGRNSVADGALSGSGEGWKRWWVAVRREAAIVVLFDCVYLRKKDAVWLHHLVGISITVYG